MGHKFSLADFGLNITKTIAFSLEEEQYNIPFNTGVALINVPHIRETKPEFLFFIKDGINTSFSAPSDQGAYLDFYKPELLDRSFNIKPYFHNMDNAKIVHFHGPKPHEWFKVLLGETISSIFNHIKSLVFW